MVARGGDVATQSGLARNVQLRSVADGAAGADGVGSVLGALEAQVLGATVHCGQRNRVSSRIQRGIGRESDRSGIGLVARGGDVATQGGLARNVQLRSAADGAAGADGVGSVFGALEAQVKPATIYRALKGNCTSPSVQRRCRRGELDSSTVSLVARGGDVAAQLGLAVQGLEVEQGVAATADRTEHHNAARSVQSKGLAGCAVNFAKRGAKANQAAPGIFDGGIGVDRHVVIYVCASPSRCDIGVDVKRGTSGTGNFYACECNGRTPLAALRRGGVGLDGELLGTIDLANELRARSGGVEARVSRERNVVQILLTASGVHR